MGNYVVTFARGFGSGGKEIASKLAKELGIHCYENRILTLASQLSGLSEQLFKEVNEKIRTNGGFSSFMRGLPRARHLCRTTLCFSIRSRSLRIWRKRNPASLWENARTGSCGAGRM